MKQKIFLIIFYLVLIMYCNVLLGQVQEKIHWERFISSHDMIWEKLPKSWDEGPFMGNGTLGLMLYKPDSLNSIRFDIGNSYVQDHRDDSCGVMPYSRPRLPIGYFTINPKGKIQDCDLKLELWNAVTSGSIRTDKGEINLHAYVHAEKMIIVIEMEASAGERDFEIRWNPLKHDSPRQQWAISRGQKWRKMPGYKGNPEGKLTKIENIKVYIQPLIAGGETATAWQIQDFGVRKILTANISHSWPENKATQEAVTIVRDFIGQDQKRSFKTHKTWWHNYYQQSFMSLPDKRLESFYWTQLYKLASATRADGALIDNQGPWLQETAWPGAWWNLNVQLTYWMCNASNHTELNNSLLNTLVKNKQNLIGNVPEVYRFNSAGIGRSSGQDCIAPVGKAWVVEKKSDGNIASIVPEIGLLPWACHNLWLHYRMTIDDGMLRYKLFPLLKKSINYYLHFVEKKGDGKYHLPYTYSPEYGISSDCNFDLSLLKWGCKTLIECCTRLKIDDELLPRWKEISENLVDFPKDNTGFRIGGSQRYDMSHRHYSHLLTVYPLYLVNIEQPGTEDIIKTSLEYWQSKPEALRGYSFTGGSSISSAIGKGDAALAYLNNFITNYLRPNTMYKEPSPVIETPLSGGQSVLDMVIQSWGGKIRVFPAIPSEWDDLVFHNLRAEGAFLVSASLKKREIEFVRIKSLAGEPCIVKANFKKPVKIVSERNLDYQWISDNELRLDLKKGEEAIIRPNGQNSKAVIIPVNIDVPSFHFGLLNYEGIR